MLTKIHYIRSGILCLFLGGVIGVIINYIVTEISSSDNPLGWAGVVSGGLGGVSAIGTVWLAWSAIRQNNAMHQYNIVQNLVNTIEGSIGEISYLDESKKEHIGVAAIEIMFNLFAATCGQKTLNKFIENENFIKVFRLYTELLRSIIAAKNKNGLFRSLAEVSFPQHLIKFVFLISVRANSKEIYKFIYDSEILVDYDLVMICNMMINGYFDNKISDSDLLLTFKTLDRIINLDVEIGESCCRLQSRDDSEIKKFNDYAFEVKIKFRMKKSEFIF